MSPLPLSERSGLLPAEATSFACGGDSAGQPGEQPRDIQHETKLGIVEGRKGERPVREVSSRRPRGELPLRVYVHPRGGPTVKWKGIG
jgi:hypothetical protein